MNDYISREKYLQDVEHYKNQICYMSNVSMDDCIKICNEQPSARVIELSKLENIINNTTIQEDVIRYQMICEVIRNENI